jgi:MFS family permease
MRTPAVSKSLLSLLPIYLVVFFGFVGYALMITVYTPVLMHSHIAHPTIILGILLAAYPLGQFLGSPVAGALSDHYGRKIILQLSLSATLIMYVFITVALYYFSLKWLMILGFITGIFESNVAIAMSAIADFSDESNRMRLFGYLNLAASAAYVVGPLLGGPLSNPHLVSWFNPGVPFACVVVLLLASIIFTQVFFHDVRKRDIHSKINYFSALTNVLNLIKPTRFRRLFAINFLLYTALFGFFRSYPMYIVNEFHLNILHESYFIAWVSVPLILANMGIIAWLSKRSAPRSLMAISAILVGVFMIFITLPNSIHALWVTLFLAGSAAAICLPATSAFISFRASEAEQGSVMGNNNALAVAGEAFSGMLGGLLAAVFVKLSLIVLGIIAILTGMYLCINRSW